MLALRWQLAGSAGRIAGLPRHMGSLARVPRNIAWGIAGVSFEYHTRYRSVQMLVVSPGPHRRQMYMLGGVAIVWGLSFYMVYANSCQLSGDF